MRENSRDVKLREEIDAEKIEDNVRYEWKMKHSVSLPIKIEDAKMERKQKLATNFIYRSIKIFNLFV